jgi:hypothetical protein
MQGPRLVLNLRAVSTKEHEDQYAGVAGNQARVESAFVAAPNPQGSAISTLPPMSQERGSVHQMNEVCGLLRSIFSQWLTFWEDTGTSIENRAQLGSLAFSFTLRSR